MNKTSLFICRYHSCNLFLENPITLPCGYTICKHHLDNLESIQCIFCNLNHLTPQNGFAINQLINQLINNCFHFSNDLELETKLVFDYLVHLVKEYKENDSINKRLFINDYFDNLRNQVDIHREEIKVRLSHSLIEIEDKNKLEKFIDQKSNEIIQNLYKKQDFADQNAADSTFVSKLDEKINEWRLKLRIPNLSNQDLNDIKTNMNHFIDLIKNFNHILYKDRSIEFLRGDENSFSLGRLVEKDINLLNLYEKNQPKTINFNYNSHFKQIRSIQYDEKSDRLLTGSDDKTVKIWDLNSFKCIKTLNQHDDCITGVLIGSNEIFLTSSLDGNVIIWNLKSHCLIKSVKNEFGVESMCLLPDNRLVCGLTDGSINVWNLSNNILVKSFKAHDSLIRCLILSNDSTKLLSCSRDTTIKVWDISNFEFIKSLQDQEQHTREIHSLELNQDGYLFSCSYDKTIKKWDIETGECLASKKLDSLAKSFKLIRNDLIAIGFENGEISVYDFDYGKKISSSLNNQLISKIFAFTNGNIMSGHSNGQIKLLKFDS